jgi:hypothetical protein
MNHYFLLCFVLISFCTIAQERDKSQTPLKDTPYQLKQQRQVSSRSYNVEATVVNENDPYYGRKEEFSRFFISGIVPADFPKYSSGANVDDYNIEIKAYLKNNHTLLTDQYKEKYSN